MQPDLEVKDKAKGSIGIKAEAFRKNIRKTNPHKHNSYLELVYLTAGEGIHAIDAEQYDIAAPVLFIVRQDQLHFWDITAEPEGYVLILKKEFAERYFDHELNYLFSQLDPLTKIAVPADAAGTISQLFGLLEEEIQKTKQPDIVFLSLLKALIAKILNSINTKLVPGRSSLFSGFAALLSSSKKKINSVSYYAGLLHTTPQNLNAACKKETGQPASALLSAHITAEATRLLLYTQMSVSEIAYQLNFKDNSHFSKYFRKNAGVRPSSLRMRK